MTPTDYNHTLTHLNVAKRLGQQAPHKSILLLSVIDLVEGGQITSPSFELTEALEKKFQQNWKRYVGVSVAFKPVVATPFWHMQHEPFWRLRRKDGQAVETSDSTPSIGQVRAMGIVADIDKDLFDLMKDESARAQMRTTLISTYLRQTQRQIRKALPMVIGFICTRLFV